MKNLEIYSNFGNGLESLIDTNSYGTMGNIGSSCNPSSRPVYSPYSNFQIGTVEKSYSGQEFFKENYNNGYGTPITRRY